MASENSTSGHDDELHRSGFLPDRMCPQSQHTQSPGKVHPTYSPQYLKREPAEVVQAKSLRCPSTYDDTYTVDYHTNCVLAGTQLCSGDDDRKVAQDLSGAANPTSSPPSYDLETRLAAIEDLSQCNMLAANLLKIETLLADNLMKLDFGAKVSHVYNPVDYAYKPHLEYYKKFCRSSAKVVMIGMNPGPWGMSQTGVPFGEVKAVSEWMKISDSVGSPTKLHVKRPISGFDCKRSEVSGGRIWTFLRSNFASADEFFTRCFIYNYCPLAFMQDSGKNVTPAQLPAHVKHKLTALCDEALLKSILLFPHCTSLVGVGRFAEQRIQAVCKAGALPHQQSYLLHPSPQNPHANKNWTPSARRTFEDLGILPQSVVDVSADSAVSVEAVKRKLFDPDSI